MEQEVLEQRSAPLSELLLPIKCLPRYLKLNTIFQMNIDIFYIFNKGWLLSNNDILESDFY